MHCPILPNACQGFLKKKQAEEEALFDWFHQPQYREKIQTLVKAATRPAGKPAWTAGAQALYGQNLKTA